MQERPQGAAPFPGATDMTRMTLIDEHDWLAVRAAFPDKVQANVTFSRGGERVSVSPPDPKRAEALSLVVMQAIARMKAKDPTYPHLNLGEMQKAMGKAGAEARTLDEYLDRLRAALMVSGERPKLEGAGNATTASLVAKRGWQLDVAFRSGERMALKINKSSVGLSLLPNIPSKSNEVTKLVFAVKQAGVMGDDALAEAAREVALESDDVDAWIEGVRGRVFAPAGPRP